MNLPSDTTDAMTPICFGSCFKQCSDSRYSKPVLKSRDGQRTNERGRRAITRRTSTRGPGKTKESDQAAAHTQSSKKSCPETQKPQYIRGFGRIVAPAAKANDSITTDGAMPRSKRNPLRELMNRFPAPEEIRTIVDSLVQQDDRTVA